MDFTAAPSESPAPLPPIAPPERPVNRWRWWIHLLLIGSYPLVMGLLSVILGKGRGPALSSGAGGLLLTCAVELLVFGGVFYLGWLASRATCDDLLLRWRPGWLAIPLGLGYSIALRLAMGVVLVAIGIFMVTTHIVTPTGLEDFFRHNQPDVGAVVDVSAMRENPIYFWLTLTLVSFVVAGLREELWRSGFLASLRALWPRWFGSRGGQIAGVALGAIFFGIGHLSMGVLAVFMTGALGLLLGIIMVLHRSIWPAVIAHGMFDATSLAMLPWVMEKLQGAEKTAGL